MGPYVAVHSMVPVEEEPVQIPRRTNHGPGPVSNTIEPTTGITKCRIVSVNSVFLAIQILIAFTVSYPTIAQRIASFSPCTKQVTF